MNALLLDRLMRHTNFALLPVEWREDFIEGCEIEHHAATMDDTAFCDRVNTRVQEWLDTEAWLASLSNDATIETSTTTTPTMAFSWEFEDVGDRVITHVCVSLDGTSIQDDDFLQSLDDVKQEHGITKARAFAKRYAKAHGWKFENLESDSYGYRVALMECAARNR